MPRRRRKTSIAENKAPLLFTESPVNKNQRNVPSPVSCALHPLTATAVEVNSSHLTWISPQFSEVPHAVEGRRRVRRGQHKEASVCTCGHTLLSDIKSGAKSKFKPLLFIGEHCEPESVIEDISDTDNQKCTKGPPEQSPVLVRKVRRKSHGHQDTKHIHQKENYDRSSIHGISPVLKSNQNKDMYTSLEMSSDNCRNSPVKQLFSKEIDLSLNDSRSSQIKKYELSNNWQYRLRQRHVLTNCIDSTLCSTPEGKRNVEILVTDTPEAEYGLPYKKRHLRQHLTGID